MDKTTLKLIAKITRAKIRLENAKMSHRNSCPVETDPEGFAPCNCGASNTNYAIESAIQDLSLE